MRLVVIFFLINLLALSALALPGKASSLRAKKPAPRIMKTPSPTLAPTDSTPANAPTCPAVAPASALASSFYLIQTQNNLCEVTQMQFGAQYYEFTSFACSVQSCISECYYDAQCNVCFLSCALSDGTDGFLAPQLTFWMNSSSCTAPLSKFATRFASFVFVVGQFSK